MHPKTQEDKQTHRQTIYKFVIIYDLINYRTPIAIFHHLYLVSLNYLCMVADVTCFIPDLIGDLISEFLSILSFLYGLRLPAGRPELCLLMDFRAYSQGGRARVDWSGHAHPTFATAGPYSQPIRLGS